jgi:hypothetical protein
MTSTATDRRMQAIAPPQPVPRSETAARTRLGAAALALAGILFVLYPAIRPFSDETSLQGAAAFASTAWLLAHMLAMAGFALLALGLLGFYIAVQESGVGRLAFRALVVGVLGIALTLPFYGGEAFGLHAIGQEALKQHSVALVQLASIVRSGPQLAMFLVGLLLLALGAIMVATAVWMSGTFSKWSGLPFALGFALYLPQFFGTQPLRVAHGLLVAAGCLWLAAGLWRRSKGFERSRVAR